MNSGRDDPTGKKVKNFSRKAASRDFSDVLFKIAIVIAALVGTVFLMFSLF